MDELIRQISQQTGISNEQARQAVHMVVDFAKSRLPAPLGSQLDNALTNDELMENVTDQMREQLGRLGGMFGKRE